MRKKYQEKIKELEKKKKAGEEIKYVPKISGVPQLILFLSIALLSFICGRVFYDKIYVLLLTNLLSMWMMVDVARTLIHTQDACILVTNKRIYGQLNQREINIYYRDIRQVHNTRQGIYIDGGNAHDRVLLRFLADREETYEVIRGYTENC